MMLKPPVKRSGHFCEVYEFGHLKKSSGEVGLGVANLTNISHFETDEEF
jgi:hypothetical protein